MMDTQRKRKALGRLLDELGLANLTGATFEQLTRIVDAFYSAGFKDGATCVRSPDIHYTDGWHAPIVIDRGDER